MESHHQPAPKIFKQDCQINFKQPVQKVHDFCRGLSPYPAAWCKLIDTVKDETKTYKIFGTKISEIDVKDASSIQSDSSGLLFPCKNQYLTVTEIQAEGKRRMHFKDFLAGNSIENLVISEV
jgi:methionyl-tRNA formyltransferase